MSEEDLNNPNLLRRRVNRRVLLRSVGVGSLGLGAAALVGCGDDDDGPAGTATGAPSATDVAGTPTPAPQAGGHLRIAWGLPDARFLNPLLSNSILEHYSVAPGFCTLLQYDHNDPSIVAGDLAETWEFVDPTTLVFNLVETEWHDGEPFSADDVKYTFDRTIDEDDVEAVLIRAKRNIFSAIASIEATDPRTVTMALSRAQVTLPNYFAWGVCGIIPEHKSDEELADLVVGTGPYIMDRFEAGTGIFYNQNPNYHEAGLPLLDELSILYITDENARITALEGGEIDACGVSTVGAEGITGDIEVDRKQTLQAVSITASRRNPRFEDERIQRALYLNWDRQAAVDIIERGQALVGGALPPGELVGGVTLSSDDLATQPGLRPDKDADRTEATQLLSAAGFDMSQGVKVMVETSGAGEPSPIAEFALDQLTQIGLTGVFDPVDTTAEGERRASGDFDTFVGGGVAFVPEPLGSRGFWQAPNDSGYENQQVEDLVAQIDAAEDEDERASLTRDLEDQLLETPPYSVIFWRNLPVARASNVTLPHGLGFAQGLKLHHASIS